MVFRQWFSLFLSLSLGLQLPCSFAVAKAEKVKTKSADKRPPEEKEYPWWLEGLRTRFTLVASGLQLLKDEMDIDAAVGDNPWTLRTDTQGAIKFLPIKMQLGLAQFLTSRIGNILVQDRNMRVDDKAGLAPQLNARNDLSADFVLSEEMSRDLVQSTVLDQLRRALSEEQMVDLAIFILSKQPFFPKENDWAGWENVKKKIIYYDVYLILAVITMALMFDKGQIKVSGYLFKINGDQFRVGWYGGFKNLGAHLRSPEFKAGLKLKGELINVEAGVKKRLSPEEQTAIELNIGSQIFSELIKPMGWASDGHLFINNIRSDEINPNNVGETSIGFSSTIRNERLRTANDSLAISLQNSFSYNTKGRADASATVILNDAKYGYDLSASITVSEETGPTGKTFSSTRVGALAKYQWDGGAKALKHAIFTDGQAIRALMADILVLKRQPENYRNQSNLTILRESLKLRVQAYTQEVTRMIQMLHPDERSFPISDQEFAYALLESEQEIKDPGAKERAQKMAERLYFHN